METSTPEGKHGIQWTSRMQLDDRGFISALAHLSQTRQQPLELKTTLNQHQSQNFQYKCQDISTVCSGNLENYENHHPEDTNAYSQLSIQSTSDPLVRRYQQHSTVGENKPDCILGGNQEDALEVNRDTLRIALNCVTRQALACNQQSQIRRGRPKYTLGREMETDMRRRNNSLIELERQSLDRVGW
ncbi:unnamed protein product [Schistosoma mattheei]|uniref:Uncharacterized protein n=1 Tax=Schistosoma mattheei TaxID=31246 RepID=A0A183PHU1_9TREM|nr:unnamed protein product [Schistosoma mattheei]